MKDGPESICSIGHKEVEGVPVLSLKGDCDELLAAAARCIIQGYLGMDKRILLFDVTNVSFVKPGSYEILESLCRDVDEIRGRLILIGAGTDVQERFRRFNLTPGCLVTKNTFDEALEMAREINLR